MFTNIVLFALLYHLNHSNFNQNSIQREPKICRLGYILTYQKFVISTQCIARIIDTYVLARHAVVNTCNIAAVACGNYFREELITCNIRRR